MGRPRRQIQSPHCAYPRTLWRSFSSPRPNQDIPALMSAAHATRIEYRRISLRLVSLGHPFDSEVLHEEEFLSSAKSRPIVMRVFDRCRREVLWRSEYVLVPVPQAAHGSRPPGSVRLTCAL